MSDVLASSWLLAGIGVVVFFLAMGLSQGDSELFAVSTINLVPVGVGTAYHGRASSPQSRRLAQD